AQERSVRVFQSARNIDIVAGLQFGTIHLERCGLVGASPLTGMAEKADQHLRSPSWFVAAKSRRRKPAAELSRAHGSVAALRAGDGLHPHRTAADRGASVRRFVGLSGHKLLCAHESSRKSG